MAKKYYAVRKGRTPGIYYTWGDCQKQILQFKGAIYKGFDDLQEANQFIHNSSDTVDLNLEQLDEDRAIAYVDGSFHQGTGQYSCGVVLFYRKKTYTISECGTDESVASMRNVAGEILGSRKAMELAIELGCKKLTIVHDYQGIASWCKGEWKTNKEGTIAYKKAYDEYKQRLEITFSKVKGHSGDKFNDQADELAKKALGL